MVHLEAISGLGNQKKSLLINELAALGDSLHPLHRSTSTCSPIPGNALGDDDSQGRPSRAGTHDSHVALPLDFAPTLARQASPGTALIVDEGSSVLQRSPEPPWRTKVAACTRQHARTSGPSDA